VVVSEQLRHLLIELGEVVFDRPEFIERQLYQPPIHRMKIRARTEGVAHAPEVYGDLTSTRWFAEFAVGLLTAPSMAELIVVEGWATREQLDDVITAVREWGELPDAFASWLYCGALGWLE